MATGLLLITLRVTEGQMSVGDAGKFSLSLSLSLSLCLSLSI